MKIYKQHLWIERKYPRIETGIHCVVGLPGSELSAAYILDLSEDGLKFSCGRHTLYDILPEDMRTPDHVTGVMIEIHFELPRPDLPALVVKCNASLVHFARLAQDEFHAGVKFSHMDKATRKGLQAYLRSVLETRPS